jgi:hypothetical protein
VGLFSNCAAASLALSSGATSFLLNVLTAIEFFKTWATIGSFIFFSMLALFFWGVFQYVVQILDKASLSQLSQKISTSRFSADTSMLATSESAETSLASSFDRDLDFFSSTDFEDLLVFTLDVLELLWQDVNLLVELCGDNAFFLGAGLGLTGFTWLSKKVFSIKRFKR